MKMDPILIKCGNITPNAAEVDHDSVISCWGEAERYFSSNSIAFDEKTSLKILIDAKAIREKINDLKPENCDKFFQRYLQEKGGIDLEEDHPFSAILKVTVSDEIPEGGLNRAIFLRHFTEQLFLAMNICTRGGCSYGSISIDRSIKEHALHCGVLELGWHRAIIDNWPRLKNIAFDDVWKWMERNGGMSYLLAETPVSKAFAVLLHLSYKSNVGATDVVQLSQVLESFYLSKGEPKARGLSKKIPAVIGDFPENGKRWLNEFYKLRSDIVHGDFPIFRPRYGEEDSGFDVVEERYWEISGAIDRGVSIIIATMQDLILKNSNHYSFKEEIVVETGNYG
jgi:hypothetical protein